MHHRAPASRAEVWQSRRASIAACALHAQQWTQAGRHVRLCKGAGEVLAPAEAQEVLLCMNGLLPRCGLPSGVLDVPAACLDVMQGPDKNQKSNHDKYMVR